MRGDMGIVDTSRGRPIRWFFLVWAGLAYLWGIMGMWGVNPKTLSLLEQCEGFGLPQNPCTPGGFVALFSVDPLASVAFTALLAFYVVLLWQGLAGSIPGRLLWPYLALQGALVFAVSLVARQQTVTLSLYLALLLAAISLFRRTGAVLAAAGGCIALFLLAGATSGTLPARVDWRTTLLGTDYPALILFVVGYLLLYAQHIQDKAHRAAAHADLAATHAQLEQAHAQLVASAARIEELTLLAERQRLARDLHDTLAQGLTGVIMQLQAANARLATGRYERAHEAVQQAMACARVTLADARGAIDDLRAPQPPARDLPALIQEDILRLVSATGVVCSCEVDALACLPAALADQACRAIREGVSNVVRHARATSVWISALREGAAVIIEIRDDGIGFDAAAADAPGHYGLVGLRERARSAGGDLVIRTARGAGTTLRLRIPCVAGDAGGAIDPVAGCAR
jgi:NarL family two-component system sensor histidine kinase YdfH